jgi:hypothetical protein
MFCESCDTVIVMIAECSRQLEGLKVSYGEESPEGPENGATDGETQGTRAQARTAERFAKGAITDKIWERQQRLSLRIISFEKWI